MTARDDYPNASRWLSGDLLSGFHGDAMEVEVAAMFTAIDRLRVELAAARTEAETWKKRVKAGFETFAVITADRSAAYSVIRKARNGRSFSIAENWTEEEAAAVRAALTDQPEETK